MIRSINKKKSLEYSAVFAVFGLILCYLILQFRNVMVYYDDYGYYSLSYVPNFVHQGNTYTMGELFAFLANHYVNGTHGRLLYFFIWLSAYCIGGLPLVQLLAALFVFAVLVLLWRVIVKYSGTNSLLTAILVCVCYGLFDITLHRMGTYWMAAFFLYVGPLVPFLLFQLFYKGEEKPSCKRMLVLGGLIFLSAYSQEQWAVATLLFTCILLVYQFVRKKPLRAHLVYVGCALLGLLILFLSPGLHKRAGIHEESFGLLTQIFTGSNSVLHMFFATASRYLQFGLHLAVGLMSFWLACHARNRWIRLFDGGCAVACGIMAICYRMSSDIGFFIPQSTQEPSLLFVAVYLLVVMLFALQIIRFYLHQKNLQHLFLFLTGLGAVGAMVVLPDMPVRLLLGPWFLFSIVIVDGILIVTKLTWKKLLVGVLTVLLVTAVSIPSIGNALEIYFGYKINAEIHHHNDVVLVDTANQIRAGNDVDTVYLKRVSNALYGSEMQYYEGYSNMSEWMNAYYELPRDLKYIFTFTGEPAGSTLETCLPHRGYWEDGWVGTEAEIDIKTGDRGIVCLTGRYTEQLDQVKDKVITITCNGISQSFSITERDFVVEINTTPNEIVKLEITTNFAFQGTAPDQRMLSFVLVDLEGK